MIDMLLSRVQQFSRFRFPVLSSLSAGMSTAARSSTFFLGTGENIDKNEFMQRISESSARLICIGENHEDAHAHALELEILRQVQGQKENAKLALSLEFYDREAQTVLNEYLQGLVNLDTFLSDSKPPGNHADYQELIEFCKEEGIDVIAANCPRRYTRMVGKNGKSVLDQISESGAKELLPPLPYSGASDKYRKNFISIMEKMGNLNPNVPTSMLDAQSLWDATMAHSMSKGLETREKIVHVTGYFHIQYKLGTIEHLDIYSPSLDILTIVILPSEELSSLNPEQLNLGDLIVLTDINDL